MNELILSILGMIGSVLGYFCGYKQAVNKIQAESNEKVSKYYKKAKEKSDLIDLKYTTLKQLRDSLREAGTSNSNGTATSSTEDSVTNFRTVK